MDSVTVSELNRQTAKVLDRVKAGERRWRSVKYGRPVAPHTAGLATTGAPLLDRLIAQGRAAAAANMGPIPPTPPRADDEAGSLSATLAEIRDDERY